MTDQDMRDLAAYYACLPRVPSNQFDASKMTPDIASIGSPLRNIPPCGACHGGIDVKAKSPWLGGQSAVYIKAQLEAFAKGTRHNDISEQMRNIARQMTPDEIEAVARYYEAQPYRSTGEIITSLPASLPVVLQRSPSRRILPAASRLSASG